MRNKGFTLVELLAVIAILAILVIVAMPNVLGMFNEAKVNVFVTDVQKIIDAATTSFTKDALSNAGKTVYYSSVDNATLKTKKLNMSGSEKEYFIEIDRNGNFKRIVVYDDNYCYDIYSDGTTIKRTGSKSKLISDKISKTTVNRSDIWESGSDTVTVSGNGSNSSLKGCDAKITVDGNTTNQIVEKMKIDNVEYNFIPGMTWEEWVNSEYNTIGVRIRDGYDGIFRAGVTDDLRYRDYVYDGGTVWTRNHVLLNQEVLKLGDYYFVERGNFPGIFIFGLSVGKKYYDFSNISGVKYGLELKTNTVDGFGRKDDLID